MSYSLFDFLQLLGALGLFIYGMKVMSDGIQKAAGSRLREIMSIMTSNRMMGVFTGFLITAIIQSSSATTVMVVSFVNAGLLTLVQSLGVIMGANIGTTITAWIIATLGFKVKMVVISFVLIGIFFPLLFVKNNRLRYTSEFIMGFGILFIGLDFLKSSVPDIKSNPQILEFLNSYTDNGMLSVMLFVFIGTILTIVIQSSSATMAITLVMVSQGWIDFTMAAGMVLGENIGTTVTANLAALVGNVHAKRAAMFHSVFNLLGVTWVLIVFPYFLRLVDHSAMYLFNSASAFSPVTETREAVVPITLSLFHSFFNVSNTILLAGFAPYISRVLERVIKPKTTGDEQYQLEFLSQGIMHTAELSLLESKKEIARFGGITRKALGYVHEIIEEKEKKNQAKLIEKVAKYEEITDKVELEITKFLTSISEAELSADASRRLKSMLIIAAELENIGDVCYKMSISLEKKIDQKVWFSQDQRDSLKSLYDLVDKALERMIESLDGEYSEINLEKAIALEQQINRERDKCREKNYRHIEKGKIKLQQGLIFNDLISGFENVGDHVLKVSEAATGKNIEYSNKTGMYEIAR